MLFSIQSLTPEEVLVVARIDEMRSQLRHIVREPRRWSGLLARITRAKAILGSNSVEGINVTEEDALAAVDGEDPAEADRKTWRAVLGYRQAMDYILQRCRDRDVNITRDIILAVHFMITQDDLSSNPGNLRPGWVGVRNSDTGEIVHEGIDRSDLDSALAELITALSAQSNLPTIVRAALAHLNLVMMHPFSDGNGRTARCIQTALLAKDGVVAPEFSSIEEYIGKNQASYYAVLSEVGGGKWAPQRDAHKWIRFCLTAHYRQAKTVLRRQEEISRTYDELQRMVLARQLNERMTMALVQASLGVKVRNSSYRVTVDVSNNLASRDLKQLVDAGLLVAEGEKRGRAYVASLEVRKIRQKHRLRKETEDPFDVIAAENQPTLF
jgi:Fic family protein